MRLRHRGGLKPGPNSITLWVERLLWLVMLGCVGFGLSAKMEVWAAQREAQAVIPHAASNAVEPDAAEHEVGNRSAGTSGKSGELIGRMQIQAIGLSVPVLEDDDVATLRRGVGHIPGTAVPGGLGNLVLAGHRDTFFRPLRAIQPGMMIEVTTTDGHWWYEVGRTEIVTPDRIDLLGIGSRPEMTLITCYPFEYIGAAPKRFVVHAFLRSADPS